MIGLGYIVEARGKLAWIGVGHMAVTYSTSQGKKEHASVNEEVCEHF